MLRSRRIRLSMLFITGISIIGTMIILSSINGMEPTEKIIFTLQHPEYEKHQMIIHPTWFLPPMTTDLPIVGNLPAKYWRNDSRAPREFTQEESQLMMEMLRVVDEVFRKWNITYYMCAGTLMGSWLHHNIIPWDDDIDIIADFWKRHDIYRALSSIGGVYKVYETARTYYKLYRIDGAKSGFQLAWTWPFVDIFLFIADEDNVWEYGYPDRQMSHQIVFPLILRPMGSLWLPAPRNASALFIAERHLSDLRCITNSWNHRKEIGVTSRQVNCTELRRSYPFVSERRSAQPPWMSIEKLMIGEYVLQEVPIRLPGF